jgi:hypothetical protein
MADVQVASFEKMEPISDGLAGLRVAGRDVLRDAGHDAPRQLGRLPQPPPCCERRGHQPGGGGLHHTRRIATLVADDECVELRAGMMVRLGSGGRCLRRDEARWSPWCSCSASLRVRCRWLRRTPPQQSVPPIRANCHVAASRTVTARRLNGPHRVTPPLTADALPTTCHPPSTARPSPAPLSDSVRCGPPPPSRDESPNAGADDSPQGIGTARAGGCSASTRDSK